MNLQRFHAPTAREALAKARMTFGEGTLILSNRSTPTGVEVLATAEESLAALDQGYTPGQPSTATSTQEAVNADADQLTMSTLSFQDYVRERMLRRRKESLEGSASQKSKSASRIQIIPAPEAPQPRPATTRAPEAPAITVSKEPRDAGMTSQEVVSELQAMKAMIEERFSTMAWLGQAQQSPVQSNLMLKLIRAGYSPALSRLILEKLPLSLDATESTRWIMDVLERNLKTDANQLSIEREGGIYALVGTTGVGKTTTAAKLAGLCAKQYGPGSVGLITLDTYRVGAHEQLRTYGRMLGVVAHLAHDRAALQDLLNLLANKKMVLVDTSGIAPRDPRKNELLDVLSLPNVRRLLVMNAACQGETMDEVVDAFKSTGVQQTVLSKVDEAVKLGPALDACIRHQLMLRGVTTGQRVPEDWEAADAAKLIRASMRLSAKSAFDPQAADLGYIFTQSQSAPQGILHA